MTDELDRTKRGLENWLSQIGRAEESMGQAESIQDYSFRL